MNNVPNLRFKEFSGEGEHKYLNEIVERITRKNKGLISKLPLTISAQYGLVDQETFFNKTVASKNLEGYYLLKNGEFAYNKSYSNGYPWGAIKRLDKYECGVLSSLYICFKPYSGMHSNFLTNYFETTKWHKEVSMIAVEGARNHGLLNIAVNDFFETLHYVPNIEEQEKIASFFSLIDKKIELQTEKVEELKNYKKGIMQKIFSQELRFKDENGNEYPEWEEVSLHQIGGTYTGLSGKTKADFGFGHGRFVTYINVFNNTLAKQVAEQVNVSEKENQSLVLKGDLLFTTSSETPNEVGMVSCWNYEMQNLYLNSFCFGYRIHNQDSYLPIFLAYMLRSGEYRKKISILAQGSTRYNISKTELMKMKVQCPCMEEQQKIVALLLNLESKVEHEQNKLNEFIQYKKGLLQQMFI